MKSSLFSLRSKALLTSLSFTLALNMAQGAVSYTAISTNANSGIDLSRGTYTHALDFGPQPAPTTPPAPPAVPIPGALINGLQFVPYTSALNATGANNFRYSATLGAAFENNGGNPGGYVAGGSQNDGLRSLLTDFFLSSYSVPNPDTSPGAPATVPAADDSKFVLSGLNIGQSYELRIYTRGWNDSARLANIAFVNGSETTTLDEINQNYASTVEGAGLLDSQAYYINYSYIAEATDLTVNFGQPTANNSWHLYGITNQAIPETSSSVLGAVGALCVLTHRRRKA